jgi:hypothetical protein
VNRHKYQFAGILGFLALLAVLVGAADRLSTASPGAVDAPPARIALDPLMRVRPPGPIVPGPRLDHPAHTERGLDCTDCHELDDAGEPGMPTFETCWDCHEDIEEEGEPEQKIVGVFFDEAQQPLWRRALLGYSPDVIFGHARHEKAGECNVCHGDMAVGQGRRAQLLFDMDDCMSCHQEKQAPNRCETCHVESRTTVPPRSHGDPTWLQGHGPLMRTGQTAETQHRCEMCHAIPQDCNTCHQQTRPASHSLDWERRHGPAARSTPRGAPGDCTLCHKDRNYCDRCHQTQLPQSHALNWEVRHGPLARSARPGAPGDCAFCHWEPSFCDRCHQEQMPRSHRQLWMERHGELSRRARPGEQGSCTFCHHDRSFCETCHLTDQPRSHTTLFRTRTHGVMAAIDRTSCYVCHNTDFCQRCHEDTPPRSHRGMWARGRNTHCVQCHFPVTWTQSCRVCHRDNPTHPTAPPQPPATHTPGRNCRICHNAVGGGGAPPLRHLDNGQNCEFCHR